MKMKLAIGILLLVASMASAETKWWEEERSAKAALEERTISEKYKSRINWEDGYLEVTAGGTCNIELAKTQAQCYSMSLKTARMFALEKLAEIIYGVRIDSDNLFVNEVEKDVSLKTSTEGLIEGARELALYKTEFDDGSIWVEITMGLTLTGEKGLSSVVVPWMERQTQASPPSLFAASASRTAATPDATGLIVDATGFGVRPALAPRILVQGKDQELYGRVNIERSAAIRFGVVGYTDSIDKAKALTERIGGNPMVVKAVAAAGAHNADVLLSVDDASEILAAEMKNGFLKECKVVFVVG